MQLILTSPPPGLFERNFLMWNPWSFGKLTRHPQGRQKAGANGEIYPGPQALRGPQKCYKRVYYLVLLLGVRGEGGGQKGILPGPQIALGGPGDRRPLCVFVYNGFCIQRATLYIYAVLNSGNFCLNLCPNLPILH